MHYNLIFFQFYPQKYVFEFLIIDYSYLAFVVQNYLDVVIFHTYTLYICTCEQKRKKSLYNLNVASVVHINFISAMQ